MKYKQNWTVFAHDGTGARTERFPAEVPGNVQRDLARHMGWLDSLQYADNVRKLEPYRNCFWTYETRLAFEAEENSSVFFVAEGIDYEFDILLDGSPVWHQEGMYTPVELDLTGKAQPGSLLSVVIHPHPCAPNSPPNTRDEARLSCKPPVTYGWDWNPHLHISGIWKNACIECRKPAHIRSCEPFYRLDLADRTARVWFETDCGGEVEYIVRDREGTVLYQGTDPSFTLTDVQLWWCSGQGEPYLYHWSARSADDEKQGRIGFRTVRLVQNPGASREPVGFPKSRYAAPITLELNGRRIFAKGSNWVNPELFFGAVTRERYAQQVKAAKDANMNIFRIWGGSGICKNDFYELCDENGIMVWQEFMLACNNYNGGREYLAVLEREATSIVRMLRRYPSIVLWCGGNELFNGWSGMDDQSPALRLLNKVCYELDPDRAFLMTSPLTGMAHGGYTFRDESGRDVFEIFQNAHNTAYTEFGVPSMADPASLEQIIPREELFPIRKTDAWVFHHAFRAWGEERWSCQDIVEHYFGPSDTLEQFCSRTAWLQCTGYQAIFEESRRQWPYCSMAINWCYNEPWITAANNALITYPHKLKPAWFAVRDALRPSIPTARIPRFDWKSGEKFTAELWYLNDAPEAVSDSVRVSILLGDKTYDMLTWDTGEIPPLSNQIGPSVNLILPAEYGADELVLRLQSLHTDRCNEYRLVCHAKAPAKRTRQLNV